MSTPQFSTMTKAELRAYVVANPNDTVAFHAFVDRCTAEASPETFAPSKSDNAVEEVELLIRQKLEQLK